MFSGMQTEKIKLDKEDKKEQKRILKHYTTNYPLTIFVHPKADPREPRQCSESKMEMVKEAAYRCVIL